MLPRAEGVLNAAFVIDDVSVGSRITPKKQREQNMEGVAVFPHRKPEAGLRIVVLMRNDAAQRVPDIGEFASASLEDGIAPAMMSKVRKSVDVVIRRFISLHRKEHVDAEACD
jgi:hypothetical protein